MKRLLASLLLPVVLCVAPAQGQSPAPQGAPFSTAHFAAYEYGAQPQNWSAAQGAQGLMYFANSGGILQYDGARWRLIETGTGTRVRSVAADSQGTVYAGAGGDFGVLRPDSVGTLRYVSLAERLPSAQQDFEEVWYIHAVGGNVYFQSRSRLFRWNGDTLRSWKSEGQFHTSFAVRGRVYVRESGGRGLLRVEGDSLQVAPGGERFADKSIYLMLPHGDDDILVGRSGGTFFLYDGETFAPFSTEAAPLLEETPLYHGTMLPGGEMALATLGGGVLIIDRAGRLVRVLQPGAALPSGTVNHVYLDDQGGLWMALNSRGLARAEVSSPLSRFGDGFGLEGIIHDLHRHDGTLYAATGAGLYALTERPSGARPRHRFEKVTGAPAAWSLLSNGGALYVATRGGVYRVREGRAEPLLQKQAFSLAAPESEGTGASRPGPLYVGTADGLGVLRRTPGSPGRRFQLLARTGREVRATTLTDDGALWFSTDGGGV
ncbi:MAG: histidine kinase, partial [Bacteroidetes bacterium QS_8_68_15]